MDKENGFVMKMIMKLVMIALETKITKQHFHLHVSVFGPLGTKLEEEKISDSVFEVTSIDDKSVKSEVNAVEEEVFKNSSTNQENEKRISDEEISKDETKDERKEQEQSFYQKNELDKEEEIRRKCESNEQFEPENFKEDEEEGNHHDDMGNGSIENKADISPNFEISNKQFENKIPQSIQLCESGKETEFSPTPSEELSKRIAMKYNYTVKEDEFDSPFYPRKTDKIRSWLEEEYENQEKDYSGISLGKTFFSNFGMASFHTIL
ncbi:uncharacterized protein MONOS_4508 [Monocercomonoides exilis]|uniref:uncharacterized protein n=1 Tax=Monocercomonoides exilis TaxID=2049356 RepID=UPI003559846B|nr:hypothetical protein MONOS_4508 [Monocercomonoides exilis]|eukprot:MONOS_4508.1-p1 / transcript=MONOS_4508.1 / gene=MONOS_4508 / organism=Monocercomonoides_exilis_PA203 / gene_product=unspecified product / transcript_product=unspecified product / location=Mono_scaffold00121:5262-6103(-) / protein_length=265 / sequence_SO=supercontig / SO=protein_coding / is_pseudo=false